MLLPISIIIATLIEVSESTPWINLVQKSFYHSAPHSPQPAVPHGDRDPLDKPAIQPPINRSLIGPPLHKYLPAIPSNITEYDQGLGPKSCKDYFTAQNITDWEAFRATFADCTIPWTMCRQLSAEASREHIVDVRASHTPCCSILLPCLGSTSGELTLGQIFSHIPVSMRNLVRHVIAARAQPSRPAGYAEWAWGDVHALGLGGLNMWVFPHELGHGIDWSSVPNAPRGGEPFSSGQAWRDALAADSAVVSEYVRTNEHEAFAETIVVALFDVNVHGGLKAVNSNWTAVETQVETVKKALGRFLIGGGSCEKRLEDSPAVPI